MTGWELAGSGVQSRPAANLDGPTWPPGASEEPVAFVQYALGSDWLLTVERRVLAPAGGPTALRIDATPGHDEDSRLGGLDSPSGITQADLRTVPMGAARELLQELCVEHRASQLIADLPRSYTEPWHYARLADVVNVLDGFNVRNPAGVIAGLRTEDSHNTWAARIKRARTRGMLTAENALTSKARALLGG